MILNIIDVWQRSWNFWEMWSRGSRVYCKMSKCYSESNDLSSWSAWRRTRLARRQGWRELPCLQGGNPTRNTLKDRNWGLLVSFNDYHPFPCVWFQQSIAPVVRPKCTLVLVPLPFQSIGREEWNICPIILALRSNELIDRLTICLLVE